MPQFLHETNMISYEVVRSSRAKRISIIVYPDSRVVMRLPRKEKEERGIEFLKRKATWVARQQHIVRKQKPRIQLPGGRMQYKVSKKEALAKIVDRVKYFNSLYNFSYKKIAIRNQKSRWGSCSRSGNLYFNYRLLFVEPELLDYVVVHELCHLKEHNHQPRFWALVARVLPDYQVRRKALRRYTF